MRIGMVNWSLRRVGGAESYIEKIIRDLVDAGHDIALWHEMDRPTARAQMALPASVPRWNASELGVEGAVERMRDWNPDVTLTHGVFDPATHGPVMAVATAVY